MSRVIQIIFAVIITSLFYFPIGLKFFLPAYNTKLMLATLGVVLFLFDLSINGKYMDLKKLLTLVVFSLGVSLCGLISVIVNNTLDYSYASYVFSMLTWFCGAYTITRLIQSIHGRVNLTLIANYLIAVCVFQCFVSILNDQFPSFKNFIDNNFEQGQNFINDLTGTKRKYGLGANLDTAGVRFSIVLCMIPIIVKNLSDELKQKWILFYAAAFLFISVEGNIIARSTMVGMGIGLIYIIFNIKSYKLESETRNHWLKISAISIVIFGGLFTTYLYKTNKSFEQDMRFGFEGFFSLVEKGKWEVSSNEKLKTMYVWPDNTKTWLIGDGYFNNPKNTDPYFVGEITGGYYKGTDVGFLRFIFYFGVIGLLAFGVFIFKCGQICSEIYPRYKLMMWVLVLLNYIVWLKVSTDIFLIFALFIATHLISEVYPQLKISEEICELPTMEQ